MNDTPYTTDNIQIAVYDAAEAPTFQDTQGTDTTPKATYKTHNRTRNLYHEEIINALNGVSPDLTVDVLVLGSSTTATVDLADSAVLGTETFRTSTTDTFTNGQTFTASTFLDSTEGNGSTFEEAALVSEQSGGDLPINRFLIDDPGGLLSPKTNSETVTIDITLTQEDA